MTGTITFLTDFGTDAPYVAQMKGVVLSIAPHVRLVDLSHAVPPQSVRLGAIVLADCVRWFPPGTVHVAVVDPGVGTDRPILAAEIGTWRFVAPDNGLWSLLTRRFPIHRVVRLAESSYWNSPVSPTFHGRDIMAPVAAYWASGIPIEAFGPPAQIECPLAWPSPEIHDDRIVGQVIAADSFGNLVTNITQSELAKLGESPGKRHVVVGDDSVLRFVTTYGEAAPDELVALVGSSGRLELAVVGGSAARRLGVDVPDRCAASLVDAMDRPLKVMVEAVRR